MLQNNSKHAMLFLLVFLFVVGTAQATVTIYNFTYTNPTTLINYSVVIFNGTGLTTWNPPTNISVSWQVVAGGGSGGRSVAGGSGGGGAGGFINGTSLPINETVSVYVGAGGANRTTSGVGNNGTVSFISATLIGNLSANGGGGGGSGNGINVGRLGGSGGGGAFSLGAGGGGTTGQGNSGGSGAGTGGGGGGGKAAGGTTAGGSGVSTSILGYVKYFSGGGGGGKELSPSQLGGIGGGGNGSFSSTTGTPGRDETGGGGGSEYGNLFYGMSGGSGIVILSYELYANFTSNVTTGIVPLPILFTDTSIHSPILWNWSFGEGNFSDLQNPIFTYTTSGTYAITLISSNATINSSATKYFTFNSPAVPITGFTSNITSGKKPLPVQFYDTSINLSYNPMARDWNFADGLSNSTDQNPMRVFANAGLYDITLIATNDMGSNSTKKIGYINVSEYVGYTRQDLEMETPYTLSLEIRDNDDHSLITQNVNIETSGIDDSVYNTTSGMIDITTDYGLLTVYVTSENYYGKYETYVMDHEQTDTIYLTPIPEPGNMNTWYTPHQVRFTVINQYGAPVQNATVSANAINATIPDIWLQTMYGINPTAANDMLNGTLIMQGMTSTDGAIVFTMHGSIRYNINVIDPATGALFATSVMPIGADYPIRTSPYAFPQVSNSTYSKIANTSLTFSEPNSSYVTLGLIYQDTSGSTTSLKFYVTAVHNRTVVYSQNLGNPGTAVRYANFTLRNERGYQYIWNYTAVRT